MWEEINAPEDVVCDTCRKIIHKGEVCRTTQSSFLRERSAYWCLDCWKRNNERGQIQFVIGIIVIILMIVTFIIIWS